MTHLRMTAHYDAPIEQVFELAVDFKRYPEWNVAYEEMLEVDGPPDQVGTKMHGVIRVLGRKMEGWGEVTEVDRPGFLKITSLRSDGTLITTYRFTPAPSGTDAVLEIDYELPAGVFGKIADKLFVERSIERDLRHSLENFKAFVEAKEPLPA